jgi:hypothetical protein
MAKRRAHRAPIGLTSNGILLLNVLELLPPSTLERLRTALADVADDWFLGVPLRASETTLALARIEDTAAEIVAKASAARLARTPRKPGRV